MPKIADASKPPRRGAKVDPKTVGVPTSELHGDTSSAPARVRISKSVTKNMGDYNSARVEVALELDVNADATVWKQIEVTITKIHTVLDAELERQIAELDL